MINNKIPLTIFLIIAFNHLVIPCTEADELDAVGLINSKGWKWDVAIYDRPGWTTTWIAGLKLLPNDELAIQIESSREGTYHDDFYSDESVFTTLSSKDGGLTWEEGWSKDYFPDNRGTVAEKATATLKDGTMIRAGNIHALPEELESIRRQKLTEAGLANLIHTDEWLIFPESMAKELRAKGYDVFDHHPTIPEGQCAVYCKVINAQRSTDGGETWIDAPVKGAPVFGRGPAYWDVKFTILPDGTILQSFYGQTLNQKNSESYVIRSTDQGKSWEMMKIASKPGTTLNETVLVGFDDGRVVAMIRSNHHKGDAYYVYSTISNDSGRTWQPVVRTPILGQPLRAILLESGNILLTYCYRAVPGGVRACISYDRGESWDLENEIILRDDVIANNWISGAGARTVQLSDGTIFSAYTILRIDDVRPGDVIGGKDFRVSRHHFHCFVVGSRYTENYVKPTPWKKKTPLTLKQQDNKNNK